MSAVTGRAMVPEQLRSRRRSARPWLAGILDDFVRGDERLAVITGLPGTGKTSALVEFILANDEAGRAVFAHFCSRRYVDASVDPYVFVDRLLRQMSGIEPAETGRRRFAGSAVASAEHNEGVVAGTYIERVEYRSEDLREALVRGFLRPLRELARKREAIIAIDGLDELDTDASPNILGLLINTLSSAPAGVKFVVTVASSHRSTEEIRRAFPAARVVDLSARSVTDEIRRDMNRYATDLGLADDAADLVAEHSRGNYAHAVSLTEACLSGRDISPNAFPVHLKERYAQILRRVFAPADDRPQLTKRILALVACAGRPLPLETVGRILTVGIDDLRGHLAGLAEIIVVDGGVSATLAHPCLRELTFFPEESDRPESLGLPLDERGAHVAVVGHYSDTSLWDAYAAGCLAGHYTWLLERDPARHHRTAVDLLVRVLNTRALWSREAESPLLLVRSTFAALAAARNAKACVTVFRSAVGAAGNFPADLLSQISRSVAGNFPQDARAQFRWALDMENPSVNLAVLDAAAHGGVELASSVYLWVLRNGSPAQVTTAPIILGAVWSVRDSTESMPVLRRLAERVSWRRPLLSSRILSFIADVCILAYANAPVDRHLMTAVSKLWEEIFRDRLTLRGGVKLLANSRFPWGVFGSRLARQVFQALDSAGGPETWERASTLFAATGLSAEHCVSMLDATHASHDVPAAVHELTESPNAVHNLLGVQIAAIHTLAGRLDADTVRDLVDRASPRGVQWILGSSAVVWDSAPVWTEAWAWDLVSRLRIVDAADYVVRLRAPWGAFTPALLGWALAAAREELGPDAVVGRLSGCDARVRAGLLDALTMCAVYRPGYCSSLLVALNERAAITDTEFRRCISFAVLCHWDRLPYFGLLDSDGHQMLGSVLTIDALHQALMLVGHFNNGVSEGVNYPVMCAGMLQPVYRLSLGGASREAAVAQYARVVCRMLIAADFRMLNWVNERQ